jgi:hypothetical protein
LDWLFDSVGLELRTALDVFDGLVDGLLDLVGWELGTALGVLDGLLDGLFALSFDKQMTTHKVPVSSKNEATSNEHSL